MTKHHSQRYCLNTRDLAALAHDGLGWGHDLDCGCFHLDVPKQRHGLIARVVTRFTKRS